MIRIIVSLLLLAVGLSAFAQGSGDLRSGERPFNYEFAKRVTGAGWTYKGEATITGILFDNYGLIEHIYQNVDWITFNITGWDHFVAYIGISDDKTGNSDIVIETDGTQVFSRKVTAGDRAVAIDIPLTGRKTMTIRAKTPAIFADPKLVKGNPTQPPVQQPSTSSTTIPPSQPATFVVDPSDLDKLASALRKRVDNKPELKTKLDNGFMAVMTFNLIDIPSASISLNVIEDLSTRMINADFQLVERGQLDKALKELKIQDSALIDQATAQKLGQLTGCNYILVGSVSDRGQFIVMNARILETATGKAIAAESVECRKIPINR